MFADLAVAVTDRQALFRPVAPMPTTWRVLDRIDADRLTSLRAARAAARAEASMGKDQQEAAAMAARYWIIMLLAANMIAIRAPLVHAEDVEAAIQAEEQAIKEILHLLRAPSYREELFAFGPADAKDGTAGRVVKISFSARLNGNEEIAKLAPFTRVKRVKLYGDFDDDGLAAIASLPQLEELVVFSRAVTDKGIAHLAANKSLKVLELHGTKATGKCLKSLRPLKELEQLSLLSLPVTNEDLKSLRHFPNLKSLRLGGTNIDDQGIQHLLALKKLEVVDLGGVELTADGIRPLIRMPNLKSVLLDASGIKSKDLDELKKLNPKLEIFGR